MRASKKQKFLDNVIFSSTLAATVQRASIYRKNAPEQSRQKFRKGLEQELKVLLEQYNNPISDAAHCENIEILAKKILQRMEMFSQVGLFALAPPRRLSTYISSFIGAWGVSPCLRIVQLMQSS